MEATAAEEWRLPAGFGASLLEEQHDSSLMTRNHERGRYLVAEAVRWLESTARQRAAKHRKQLFQVVYDAEPLIPVRDGPSRDAKAIGSRALGDLVIVDEVTPEGWVRVSPLLDTREG